MEQMTLNLPPDLAAALREAVAADDFPTEGEAVRHALRLWMGRREAQRAVLAELGRLADEGKASGDAGECDDVFGRIEARLEEKLRSRVA